MMTIPKITLITNGSLETDSLALDKILLACQNGLPAIQLREKESHARKQWELASQLRALTLKYGIFFSVNSRLDIALTVQADALHISENGIPTYMAKKFNPSLIVGVSVHSLEKALIAEQEGADYVMYGPIFETSSKTPQGLKCLEEITHKLSIPVVAVGGITAARVKSCLEAGAYGIAAISAFMEEDIQLAINQFLKEIYGKSPHRVISQ